jgi:tRNA-splicing endonuclease subunit Sen54
MAIIPRHKPYPTPSSPFEASDPFAVHFHLWKAAQKWSKLRHPTPDFYVSVVDAQETDMPSFEEITALIDATPLAPGKPEWTGPGRLYPRLKHGHRNAIVAVVDHGIINYMRFAEGAFGEEQLFERFDSRNAPRGGKAGFRGGGRGGGRGGRGGRGRGRGRSGR